MTTIIYSETYWAVIDDSGTYTSVFDDNTINSMLGSVDFEDDVRFIYVCKGSVASSIVQRLIQEKKCNIIEIIGN